MKHLMMIVSLGLFLACASKNVTQQETNAKVEQMKKQIWYMRTVNRR